MYEKGTLEEVLQPVVNSKEMDPTGATYTWYCESNEKTTSIWANFHEFDPNDELIEISTRKTCFYPEKPGINYITVKGFHFSQAATQWAAPTAEQVGMVATHWNKGWLIEDNVISDSKCSGITLGKDRSTGHNVVSNDLSTIKTDDNIHYIEVIFRTLRSGWNKTNIGSHMVRNNKIFNCGQAGICGSMGAAFSTIENNDIHHNYTKRQYAGFEMGGIKLHAAIDVVIRNNRIHHNDRGIWLDWMTQGTRVSGNLLYKNDRQDIFLEVNHGPFIVDNNILLSPESIYTRSEGGAFVHNLFAGAIQVHSELFRFTPYHLPHSTKIKALATHKTGDDRYYNNIFIGLDNISEDEKATFWEDKYTENQYPVWIDGNVYYNGAIPDKEEQNFVDNHEFNPNIKLIEKNKKMYLQFTTKSTPLPLVKIITTKLLGKAVVPKLLFENPDGTPLIIERDYFGESRTAKNNSPRPF